MSKVIAINAGSSSLKFQLFEMPEKRVITKGLVERIGLPRALFNITVDGHKQKEIMDIPNHAEAVRILLDKLTDMGIIQSLEEINGIGHRVVHGGEIFTDSVIITDQVIEKIEQLSDLAPLHNPANVTGIRAFREVLPNVPAVAVFDTAFHQTMPESSFLYSLPYHYYTDYGIRKYGFHGTSHKYVSQRAAELLERPIEQLRLISCHLGNGASIAAISGGKSIDTSMGFTPLAGVTMGTRSGNIDPALIPFIMEKTGKTADEVLDVLNRESGCSEFPVSPATFAILKKKQPREMNELSLLLKCSPVEYINTLAPMQHGCLGLMPLFLQLALERTALLFAVVYFADLNLWASIGTLRAIKCAVKRLLLIILIPQLKSSLFQQMKK